MPNQFNRKRARKLITQFESRAERRYLDSMGHPTVGIGFNLDRSDAREKIEGLGLDYNAVRNGTLALTNDQINSLFEEDLDNTLGHARTVIGNFDEMEPARQFVVVDMIFNMGASGFDRFRNTITAINEGDWATVAEEMQDSRWYDQTGRRAETDVQMMEQGQWGGSG